MNLRPIAIIALAAAALTAGAAGPQRLNVEAGAFHPVLSPDGKTLLYSSVDHTGLKAYNISTGQVTVIDEGASAGFQPVWSNDGRHVYYRTASTVDGLLYRDVRSFDMGGEVHRLAAPSRGNENLMALGHDTYAYANFGKIEVFIDGVKSEISPVEDSHSYLWASLSPDGSSLAFTEPFMGVYVSAPDGTGLRRVLPKGDYIAWCGPTTIIAVVSHDDGYVILDSSLVTVDVTTGEVTTLTEPDMLVSEATASAAGLVVFTDIDGNMYTLTSTPDKP